MHLCASERARLLQGSFPRFWRRSPEDRLCWRSRRGTNPRPATPQIDRALDSRSPDHGGVLCMISCWFSRHCFSLSSVSVSRCSKMETVCKINGQAQDGGAPGLPSARPAQLPRNKRHLFPPRLLLGALFLGFHACSCWLGKVVLCCLRAAEGHSEGQQAWWSDI